MILRSPPTPIFAPVPRLRGYRHDAPHRVAAWKPEGRPALQSSGYIDEISNNKECAAMVFARTQKEIKTGIHSNVESDQGG